MPGLFRLRCTHRGGDRCEGNQNLPGKFRPQMIFLILGMMIGSFYAIVMGPTTLDTPQAALGFENFHILWAAAGAALVLGMQMIKERSERNE